MRARAGQRRCPPRPPSSSPAAWPIIWPSRRRGANASPPAFAGGQDFPGEMNGPRRMGDRLAAVVGRRLFLVLQHHSHARWRHP
jgi:hypothetical protein